MTKAALRKQMKDLLKERQEVTEPTKRALESHAFLSLIEACGCLALYVPLLGEPDTRLIADLCWTRGIDVVVPQQLGDSFQADLWTATSRLIPHAGGMLHPDGSGTVPLSRVDLVLVPGLAFTTSGLRLGRGQGFYDRLLSELHVTSLALCFPEQVLADLPTEAHDQRIDHLIICL